MIYQNSIDDVLKTDTESPVCNEIAGSKRYNRAHNCEWLQDHGHDRYKISVISRSI